MGFTSTTKSKKYRGRSCASKASVSFTAASVVKRKALDAAQHAARVQREFSCLWLLTRINAELSPQEIAPIEALRDPPVDGDADWAMTKNIFGDVLDGCRPLDISHEGGEFEAIAAAMRKE